MPHFSIIIVSWNALAHLKTYLPSVTKTDYINYEVILADNNSTDGSKSWVREHLPEIIITELDKNYGYCGGNNRAAAKANGDVLIFLNNDVRVEPDWLNALAERFRDEPNTAAMQPKMLSDQNPAYFEYAGAAGGFLDQYGYPFCEGRIFDTVEKDEGQYDRPKDIFWASGAALAVRRKIFNEMGGFDEDFEFHMEEIDLCWRMWNAGYDVRYCPESKVYHLGGGSMPMGSPRKTYYNYRNNLMMLCKNCSSETIVKRFMGRYLLDIIAALRSLLTGDWADFKAIAKAHLHFWKSFKQIQSKRQHLQKKRLNDQDPKTLTAINLVYRYFVKGDKTAKDLFST